MGPFGPRAKSIKRKILTEFIMEKFQKRNCPLELDTNFAVLSLVKPYKWDSESAGVLGIIVGAIYIGFFIYKHL